MCLPPLNYWRKQKTPPCVPGNRERMGAFFGVCGLLDKNFD
jgi:hypothetical protein